jgi:hypothetical protein
MLLMWLLAGLALGQCANDPDPQAPFRLGPPEPNERAHLHLEVWSDELDSPWNDAILAQLEAASIHANFVLPASNEPLSAQDLTRLKRIAEQGHALTLRRTGTRLEPAEVIQLRQRVRQLKKIGRRPRAIVTPLLIRGVERGLGAMGFLSIVQTNAPNHALPRYSVVRPGRPSIGVVIPKGRYAGPCGTEPTLEPLSPANLDRVTRALHASYRDPGLTVVRIVLRASSARDTDAEVLARWLSGPMVDWGERFSTSEQIRRKALVFLRNGTEEAIDPGRPTGGRIIPVALLLRAAEEMRGQTQTRMNYVDDQLNASETFIGFAKHLTDTSVGDGVQLEQLDGPASAAVTTLALPTRVEREDIVHTAQQLIANLPERVPAASRVGATLLTADELLAAMAAAIRGDTPIEVGPIAPPEPNAPGLGWGRVNID